jgi:recombination protein RecA
MDIRRIETIKQGDETLGMRSRVKVVKNKVAPPFVQAEFDIMANEGISKVGDILDVGVNMNIIRKSGAWYYLGDDRLAQGRENVKTFLRENPAITQEIERLIRSQALANLQVSPHQAAANGTGDDESDDTTEAEEEAAGSLAEE